MRIVAGRTKAACRVHSLGGYVRFWHKADMPERESNVCFGG